MKKKHVAEGFGGVDKVVTGEVIIWNDNFLKNPNLIENKIIYCKENIPFYQAAFLVDNKAKAVLINEGGKNYHPLILFNDAQVPAVAGIGIVNIDGEILTVDSRKGLIYKGEIQLNKKNGINKIPITSTKVYANVGYPTAIEFAAKTGADGIGLLRIEFTAARTLSKILDVELFEGVTVKEELVRTNEADLIYAISKHKELREYLKKDFKDTIKDAMDHFGEKEIIIRTIDIARVTNDPMGNRGIRRCIAEGGQIIKILAEAIKESLEEKRGNHNIGILLPLVSHYSHIKTALEIILSTGLTLQNNSNEKLGIRYGWEIEQPAASQNNELWLEAFKIEYGQLPDFIGIGTNDLTQFTIALGRDAYTYEKDLKIKNYLESLYDESDFSVIKQIYEVSKQCKKAGTRVFLLGEAAAKPEYTELILSFGIIPSVSVSNVRRVKKLVNEFEKRGSPKEEIIRKYIENLCDKQYASIKNHIKPKLLEIFELESYS